MPKVDSIPCPACGEPVAVKTGKTKGKPYIKCECGLIAHATKEKSIRALSGDVEAQPAKSGKETPRKGGEKEVKKDDWEW